MVEGNISKVGISNIRASSETNKILKCIGQDQRRLCQFIWNLLDCCYHKANSILLLSKTTRVFL